MGFILQQYTWASCFGFDSVRYIGWCQEGHPLMIEVLCLLPEKNVIGIFSVWASSHNGCPLYCHFVIWICSFRLWLWMYLYSYKLFQKSDVLQNMIFLMTNDKWQQCQWYIQTYTRNVRRLWLHKTYLALSVPRALGEPCLMIIVTKTSGKSWEALLSERLLHEMDNTRASAGHPMTSWVLWHD